MEAMELRNLMSFGVLKVAAKRRLPKERERELELEGNVRTCRRHSIAQSGARTSEIDLNHSARLNSSPAGSLKWRLPDRSDD